MNSKAKGSQFERDICRLLSRWVSHGKRDDLYWRTAMSGGRATVAKRKGIDVRQTGDITAVSPEGHALTNLFFIETKFYKSLAIDSFILENKGPLAAFWKEACVKARSHKLLPMLIAKENRREPLIITSSQTIFRICDYKVRSFTILPEIRWLSDVLETGFIGHAER
jgi:hypothetical protein